MTEQPDPYETGYTTPVRNTLSKEYVELTWPPDTSACAEASRLIDTMEGTKWQLADALYRTVHEEKQKDGTPWTIRAFTAWKHNGDLTREDTYGNYLRAETFRLCVKESEGQIPHEILLEGLDISYWWMAEKGHQAGIEIHDLCQLMYQCMNDSKINFRWFAAQIQTATGRAKDFHAYIKDFIHWFKNSHEFVIGGRDLMDVSEHDAKDFAFHVEKAQEIAERMLEP